MKEVQWRSYWKINCKQVVWVAAAAQQLNDYSKILIGKMFYKIICKHMLTMLHWCYAIEVFRVANFCIKKIFSINVHT